MNKVHNASGIARRRFRSYPRYKDSGIEWLGKIPAHWLINRLRFTIKDCQNGIWGEEPDGINDIPCIRVADFDRVAFRVNMDAPTLRRISTKEETTRRVRQGDLLLEKSGGGEKQPVGAVVRYEHDIIAVCSNFIARMSIAEGYSDKFLSYLHATLYAARLNVRSIKQNTGIQNLDSNSYLNEVVAFPCIEEQSIVASFLDRETAKIDALIEKKERLIKLLQEKRSALITQAVTKGLNPAVPMKDSGIEWLGKIPKHWECLALSRISFARCDGPFGSGLKSEHYSQYGIRVVRLQNIGSAEFYDADKAYINEEYGSQLGDHSVLPGDLLIAGLGDEAHPVGRACVAPENIAPAMVKADCFRFRLDVRLLLARFAAYQLSAMAADAAGSLSTGATRSRLNLTTMATRQIALPPMKEQAVIVNVLDRGCDEIYALISKIREAITSLKEYRTALISAAVTGKIDVREAS